MTQAVLLVYPDDPSHERPSSPRGLWFLGLCPSSGVAGTETLTERALGVTSGLRKVTPDAGGLGSRGSRVGGARVVGGPGLGTLRRVRDWERARPGGVGSPRRPGTASWSLPPPWAWSPGQQPGGRLAAGSPWGGVTGCPWGSVAASRGARGVSRCSPSLSTGLPSCCLRIAGQRVTRRSETGCG